MKTTESVKHVKLFSRLVCFTVYLSLFATAFANGFDVNARQLLAV